MFKILVVEDDLFEQHYIGTLLKREEWTLLYAKDGQSAIQMAQEEIPDLVLLDIILPEMDGIEVCRLLHTIPNLAEIPMIMVTTLCDQPTRAKCIEAGADDFISKPFDPIELRTRVGSLLRLNYYRLQAEEHARFQSLVSMIPEGTAVVWMDGVVAYANPAAIDHFGVLVGGPFPAFVLEGEMVSLVRALEPQLWKTDIARMEVVVYPLPNTSVVADIVIRRIIWQDKAALLLCLHGRSMTP
ncbi:MAG TPA: response regulator [Anaerolineaceae bacterium]|nr:response regulator [Anaerolineaceae bacterium]